MKKYVLLIYLSLSFVACATFDDYSDIYGIWNFEKILDETDDDMDSILGKGNFIKIFDDHVLIMYKDIGNRFHYYDREGDILSVQSGREIVTWKIIVQEDNELQFLTPIGIFVLKRDD